MASRLHYAVAVTPIYTMDDATGLAADVLAQEWGKSFSGSADTLSPGYTLTGTNAKDNKTITTATAIYTTSSSKGLFIRHTGLDSNGDATSATLTVLRTATAVCVLEAGGAVYLPNPSDAAFTGTASSGDIVAECAHFK